MKSVLFVCLGNICRSPMAHGIFRHKAQELNLKINIESAGTSAYHVGESADQRAVSTLLSKGISIVDLRSRLFVESDFDDYDYIFTMDSSNQTNVMKMADTLNHPNSSEMVMNLAYPGKDISVPDPYYGGSTGFEDVYSMLNESLDILVRKLIKEQA